MAIKSKSGKFNSKLLNFELNMSLSVQRPTEISAMSDQIHCVLMEGCIVDIHVFVRLAQRTIVFDNFLKSVGIDE